MQAVSKSYTYTTEFSYYFSNTVSGFWKLNFGGAIRLTLLHRCSEFALVKNMHIYNLRPAKRFELPEIARTPLLDTVICSHVKLSLHSFTDRQSSVDCWNAECHDCHAAMQSVCHARTHLVCVAWNERCRVLAAAAAAAASAMLRRSNRGAVVPYVARGRELFQTTTIRGPKGTCS